ncbi:MAG: TonB family protein [Firmicutes bacterium]|nr:TonB family protein [Bacillota bacterium]
MERDSGRSRMGLAVLVSLLVHAAVILLVPVANPGRVVIYPVEFGEIEHAFESPKAGSPDGDVAAAPLPETKQASPAVQGDAPETQVAVKPAPKPEPKPAPKPEPKPAPEPRPTSAPSPKPAAKPKQQAPAPEKVQVIDSQEKQQPPKPGAASGEHAADAQAENRPPTSTPASAESETAGADTEEGTGTATADTTNENVLTGKSEETVPAPPVGAAGGGGPAAPGTASASGAATGAGESTGEGAGQTTAGPAEPSEPAGPDKAAAPAAPPKPKGEEFGTGRALVLSGVPPVYPKNAQNEGVEGVVSLSVAVNALGTATKVVVTAGSGDPRLDEAAMRAVSRGWHFQAIGWPYELSVRVTFRKGSVELAFGGVKVLGD